MELSTGKVVSVFTTVLIAHWIAAVCVATKQTRVGEREETGMVRQKGEGKRARVIKL